MERFAELSGEKLEEAKKRAVTHCLNLECKKEQLHILIEKLNTISGKRLGVPNGFGMRKSSISTELKQAEENRDIIDIEIKNVKHQLKVIDKLLSNK